MFGSGDYLWGARVGVNDERHTMVSGSHPSTAVAARSLATQVVLLDINALSHRLNEVVIQATARSSNGKNLSPETSKTLSRPEFQQAFREVLLGNSELVANPLSAPQYGGLHQDGNPISFFFRHFRLRVQAGGYYQTDLQRDSARLFNAIRNLLSSKHVRERLAEAEDQIRHDGFHPFINGTHIRDISDLSQLLPARRGLEPRRPAQAAEAARPFVVAAE